MCYISRVHYNVFAFLLFICNFNFLSPSPSQHNYDLPNFQVTNMQTIIIWFVVKLAFSMEKPIRQKHCKVGVSYTYYYFSIHSFPLGMPSRLFCSVYNSNNGKLVARKLFRCFFCWCGSLRHFFSRFLSLRFIF